MLRKNASCENCGHIGKFHDHHDNNECCYEGCSCKNMVFTDAEWEKIREFMRTSNCQICKKNFIVRNHVRREDYRISMLINQKTYQDCTMTHKVVDNQYYQKEMIEMVRQGYDGLIVLDKMLQNMFVMEDMFMDQNWNRMGEDERNASA
jgi:hypothetical protein